MSAATPGAGRTMVRKALRVLTVLWAGSMWSLAAWVAPTLFHAQADRHLAGMLAAQFFSIETYTGLAAALAAWALPDRARYKLGYAAAGLLAVNEWALKPLMAAAHVRGSAAGLGFGAWHGLSAVLYLAACLAVLAMIWGDEP